MLPLSLDLVHQPYEIATFSDDVVWQAMLSPTLQEFLVHVLLEHDQQGLACVVRDHFKLKIPIAGSSAAMDALQQVYLTCSNKPVFVSGAKVNHLTPSQLMVKAPHKQALQ